MPLVRVLSPAEPIRGAVAEELIAAGSSRPGSAESVEETAEPFATLGAFPLMALFAAIGLAVVAGAYGLSRSTRSTSQVPFWIGMLVIYVPIVFRLASREVRRGERLGLVVLLGMALYLVKVMHSPFDFLYGDELQHLHNANEIMRTHHLFSYNSLLPVSSYYPGLESVTAALSTLSGIGIFGSGVIVLGVTRLAMMLGLFLLFERVSGSAHVAGLATAAYCANSGFVFFDSQFSYESLALPLLLVVLVCIAEREAASPAEKSAWTLPIILSVGAVAVTHHLTSYALAILLTLYAGIGFVLRRRTGNAGPWPYAVLATGAVIAWLVVVASSTVGYLTPVLGGAFRDTLDVLTRESAPRQLFSASDAGGYRVAPIERIVGLGSVLLIAIAYPIGVMVTWRRMYNNALGILMVIISAVFFMLLGLRFAPDAWQTASRSQPFLFVGLAFVLGFVGLELFEPARAPWLGRALTAGALAVVFAGGVIAGWAAQFRLPQPYQVEAAGHVLHPEGVELARWAASLPSGSRFAASANDARFLITKSRRVAVTGDYNPDLNDILKSTDLPAWQLSLLRDLSLRYVVVDRRVRSFDTMTYSFGLTPSKGHSDALLPVGVTTKFDRLQVNKLYSSGTIAVYDLEPTLAAEEKR
jgi:hypothetical protein